jgi:Ran GTPase-activating protein (RanGAP) involved in mRNA processing and transport
VTLQHLDMSQNAAPPGAPFSAILSRSPSLAVLALARCGRGDRGAADLARALLETSSSSSVAVASDAGLALDLSGNGIGDTGARALARCLGAPRGCGVGSLDVSANAIGDAGARGIGRALLANTVLAALNLEGNRLSREAIEALGDMLSRRESSLVLVEDDGNQS